MKLKDLLYEQPFIIENMYCKYCGKELPNGSKFCPNCGNGIDNSFVRFKVINLIYNYFNKHKVISIIYFVWLIINLTLYINSNNIYDDSRERFFPFNMSLIEVIEGGKFNYAQPKILPEIDIIYSLDYYDFTEFFAYVILVPLIIFGFVKLYNFIFTKMSKLKQ